jgi:outer membrane protein insertion porin family
MRSTTAGRWLFLIWLGLLLAAPARSAANEADPVSVVEVQFVGLGQTGVGFARSIAGLRAGDAYDQEAVDAAVSRLIRSGRFLTVTPDVEELPEGVRITFRVQERRLITSIHFEGNRRYKEKRLREQIRLQVGDPVDLYAARDGRSGIEALYREGGYSEAAVSLDEQRLLESGELHYRIEEGPRLRIRKVRFEGNATFAARELRRQIETKTYIWILRTGAYDVHRARADEARLQNYYRDQGFLDAEVAHRVEPADDQADLTIVFIISEGSRYRIESIEFRGNSVFAEEELLGAIALRVGGFVSRPRVDQDARAIQSRYGEVGYIYTRVRAIRVFSEAPELVRITFDIEESDQYRVGRVLVRGNSRTRDKVVRRALDLYPPDDLFNLTAAREAERSLLDSRIFSSVKVIPLGDEAGVRDALIDVQEAEKVGDFIFGFGVTSNSGLVGSLVLDLMNFDLFDYPRSMSEFFKLRSFFGGGQRMRVDLQPGTDLSRFRIDFTEPYLFDRPTRFDASAYFFERGRDGYNERRLGTSVSFGRRIDRGPLFGWSSEFTMSLANVKIDDIDLFASREIREDEGNNFLPSIKGTLVRDRTDNRFIPTSGDRLRLSYEQFVGDHVFGRVNVGYSHYTTVSTDLLERKSVLELRAEGGLILGDAPVFERYYAGGTGSIRGFAFRGVGERDGIDDSNIGGDHLILLGAEYSYPLYGENLRGHVFLDTGTAGSGPYRAAVGTGVRFVVDIFGPMPIELNLAIPVSRDSDDDEQVFSFLIGRVF